MAEDSDGELIESCWGHYSDCEWMAALQNGDGEPRMISKAKAAIDAHLT